MESDFPPRSESSRGAGLSSIFSRIGSRIALALGVAVLLSVSATTAGNVWVANGLSENSLKQELSTLRVQFDSALAAEANRALSMAKSVSSNSTVQSAFADRDRDALSAMYLPDFADMKKDLSVRQFQFHVAPAESFLRVHRPEKFGDDLSGFRNTVVLVNEKGVDISGLERGVAGLGMRGVVPVQYAGNQVGSVEFGLSFGQPFFDEFKQSTSAQAALFVIREGSLDQFASTFSQEIPIDGDVMREVASSGVARVGPTIEVDGVPYANLLAPVEDFSGKVIAVAVIGFDRSAIDAKLTTGNLISLSIGIAALLAALGIAWLMNRMIARPISTSTDIMRTLSRGETNFQTPYLDRSDEVGEMAQAIEVFRENAIAVKKAAAEKIEAERKAEEEKRAVILKLADDFETAIGAVVESVSSAARDLQKSSDSMSRAAKDASEQTTSAAASVEEASSNVTVVASASEELSASIREISAQVTESASVAQNAVDQVQKTSNTVSDLSKSAESIGEIIELINNIAAQTNLLALNATIEAARAGEAGKGFAVVAHEVKSLANQTAKATEQISQQINGMQTQTRTTAESMTEVQKTIQQVNEVAAAISAAVEEQSSATQEISSNASQAATGTTDASGSISAVDVAASKVNDEAGNVKLSSDDLAGQSDRLRSEVNGFIKKIRSQ